MVSATEKLNFTFYVILTNLNLDGPVELVAVVLDSTDLVYAMEELDSDNASELETPGGWDRYLRDTETKHHKVISLSKIKIFQVCSHILVLTPPLSIRVRLYKP